jgi:hypothetical protein
MCHDVLEPVPRGKLLLADERLRPRDSAVAECCPINHMWRCDESPRCCEAAMRYLCSIAWRGNGKHRGGPLLC